MRTGLAAWTLGFALALLVMSAPAAAKPLDLTPDVAGPTSLGAWTSADTGSGPSPIVYQGGPVLHTNRTHLIFWAPSNQPQLAFASSYIGLMEHFVRNVARASRSTGSEYGITGQFTDSGGPAAYASTYGGAVLDSDPVPINGCAEPSVVAGGPGWDTCLSDAQIQRELRHVILAGHLPSGPDDIYFLITPQGFGSCQNTGPDDCALGGSPNSGYCGYHSWLRPGMLYAVIPYNAVVGHCESGNPRPNGNAADPALSTLGHEQTETITDPYGTGWVSSDGSEIADVCITSYGPGLGGTANQRWDETIAGGHYWLQELYSRITGLCAARPQPDTVSIRVPATILAGRRLRLSAQARQPGGRITAYNWNFGDRHGGRGRDPEHTYRKAGTYRVFLRVRDSAGNLAYAKRTLRVRRG